MVTRTRGFITRAIVIHHVLGSRMFLKYKVFSKKRKQQKQPRHFKPTPSAGPRGATLPFIRDEATGAILTAPECMPSGRRYSPTYEFPGNLGTTDVCELSHWSPIQKPDLEWLKTLFHLQGVSFLPPPRPLDLSWSDEDARDLKSFWTWVYPPAPEHRRKSNGRPSLPRKGPVTKRPVAHASGTPDQREQQAAIYLRRIDHKEARKFDQPEFTMLKVACNLRNYFGMDLDQTVMLMRALYNLMADTPWSREGISLAWELVAGYSSSLGLKDVDALAKQKAIDLEDEVTALLAYTRSGGRVTTEEFFNVLMARNPQLETSITAVSGAVRDITGIVTMPYRVEGRCYKGFHLPSAEELLDPAHSDGCSEISYEAPKRPRRKAARDESDFMFDAMWLPITNHMRRKLTKHFDDLRKDGRLPISTFTPMSQFSVAS